MSTVEMNEVKNSISFTYTAFNEDNWKDNVDKAFFIIALGMLYSIIRLMQHNFEASGIEIFARVVTGPFTVLLMIILIEAFAAVLVKIAFTPGILYESKFKVIPVVFWNTLKDSYKKALEYKQVYSIKTINVYKPGSENILYIFGGKAYFQGGGLCDMQGSIHIDGYLKEPEHFKY